MIRINAVVEYEHLYKVGLFGEDIVIILEQLNKHREELIKMGDQFETSLPILDELIYHIEKEVRAENKKCDI